MISASSVGISKKYRVSSNPVRAFRSGPNVLPMDSRYSTISCLSKRSVPLKAMCSTKCARPRWSSVS